MWQSRKPTNYCTFTQPHQINKPIQMWQDVVMLFAVLVRFVFWAVCMVVLVSCGGLLVVWMDGFCVAKSIRILVLCVKKKIKKNVVRLQRKSKPDNRTFMMLKYQHGDQWWKTLPHQIKCSNITIDGLMVSPVNLIHLRSFCFKICPGSRSSSYHWSTDTGMRAEPFCTIWRFGVC